MAENPDVSVTVSVTVTQDELYKLELQARANQLMGLGRYHSHFTAEVVAFRVLDAAMKQLQARQVQTEGQD